MELFTIGHSNHSFETFLGLLKRHGVTAIADVRSFPFSRRFPQFNQGELKAALAFQNIVYVFLGKHLGARPYDEDCYDQGKAKYELIANTVFFSEGLHRLLSGAKKHRVAIMCAERDPIICHRAVLICQHLRSFDIVIQHILKDGSLESHDHLEERLLKLHGLKSGMLSQDKLSSLESNQLQIFDRRLDYDKSDIELSANRNRIDLAFNHAAFHQLKLFDEDLKIHENLIQEGNSLEAFDENQMIEMAYKIQGDQIAYVDKRKLLDESEERFNAR
ncbi:hypothetical protein C8255_12980 [filamentous cyanobacterium CCP3]|nr:hypothetical protein C8255_12980 [filamentous cyanobacterium CCP3]